MKDVDLVHRKNDHLDVVLDTASAKAPIGNGFARWRFEHCALPELDLDAIDLHTAWLGYRLRAPLLISSMTGGASRARDINRHLAEAAEHLGLAMGVGSQRVALEAGMDWGLTRELRQRAPSVPLLANLGGAQVRGEKGLDYARRAVDMIAADALIVHLNPLQEAVQTGGDRDWRGVLDSIEQLVKALPVPVVIKEVGAGISAPVALRLAQVGVQMIDVAGAGGTSWAAVEGARTPQRRARQLAQAFAGWGIPTAEALVQVRQALPNMPLVASGGIRDGLEVAKALRLGADLVGQAAAVLASATQSSEAVVEHFEDVIAQLKVACFCTGSANLADLKRATLHYGEQPA